MCNGFYVEGKLGILAFLLVLRRACWEFSRYLISRETQTLFYRLENVWPCWLACTTVGAFLITHSQCVSLCLCLSVPQFELCDWLSWCLHACISTVSCTSVQAVQSCLVKLRISVQLTGKRLYLMMLRKFVWECVNNGHLHFWMTPQVAHVNHPDQTNVCR